MKVRKKPLVVEAMQWPEGYGSGAAAEVALPAAAVVLRWLAEWAADYEVLGDRLRLRTLEGNMDASPGDWIIKSVQGEFYPCNPDIFRTTYERVED